MTHLKQIVGLDIGARNARAVWMQLRGGAAIVTRAAQMVLPLEGEDRDKLLRSWLASQGLQRGFAAIAIPGTQLVFQPGRLTPDDPRTPQQASEMELATFNDMAGDSMAADVTAHEWTPGARIYLMGMARPGVISDALADLEPLEVRAADLVPAPVALFNALATMSRADDHPSLYINFGHTHTELAIGTNKGILFARAFPLGGKMFTEAIAKIDGISLTQAETQKHRNGSINADEPYAEVLRPLLERWYNQILTCLSAYRSTFGGEQFILRNVILSGGGARLRGLSDYLTQRLDTPVTLANDLPGATELLSIPTPSKATKSGDAEATPPDANQYAIALGLALTGLGQAASQLSLLPEHLRGEAIFREKKPYLIAASILGAMALGVITASMVIASKGEIQKLDAERAELRRREEMDKSITSIRQRGDDLRKRSAPLAKLLMGGPIMREVITLVANAISPSDWISLICEESSYSVDMPEGKKTPPQQQRGFFMPSFRHAALPSHPEDDTKNKIGQLTPAPEASDFNVFIVEGYTPDMSLGTVKSLILRLQTARRVNKVDLLSDDRVLPPTLPDVLLEQDVVLPNMRRFVIRLEVVLP